MKPITLEWVAKAEGDWNTAQREYRARQRPNYDAACFHAQQDRGAIVVGIEKHVTNRADCVTRTAAEARSDRIDAYEHVVLSCIHYA